MIRFRSLLPALCCGLLLPLQAQAPWAQSPVPQFQGPSPAPSPAKVAAIKELLKVTGSINLSNQLMARMIDAMKPAYPQISPAAWERLARKLDAADLVEELVRIYDRHFSMPDLEATLAFYRTPAGQRMLQELPAVMNEAMVVGQAWGEKRGAELQDELKREAERATKEHQP